MTHFTPRPWQRPIIDFVLRNERCCVFAAMGSGKTSAVLTAIDMLRLSGELDGPVLVIAPKRVALNTWPGEVKKWAHLKNMTVAPIVGSEHHRTLQLAQALRGEPHVYTINYDNIEWLIRALNGRWPFAMVVADESTRLKGFRSRQGGKRAGALRQVAFRTQRWVNLTGTPAPNGLQDLWGQLWFIDQGERLGRSFSAFESRWFTRDYGGYNIIPQPFAREQIEERIRDVCITINPADYMPIDKLIFRTLEVELPPKAMALYKEFEREMFIELEGESVEAFNAAAKSIKCLQLANGAVYVDEKEGDVGRQWQAVHDAKLELLDSLLAELNGEPLLVAYHFQSDLARLRKAFPKGRVLDDKKKTEDDWNASRVPLLFAHPASAGHGLNLQDGGCNALFFGNWWDSELYEQFIERIGPLRQMQSGHPRPVTIYHAVAVGTLDEVVMARRKSKCTVQEALLEAMKRRQP